jgi:predicted dehydrogenase
MKPIRVAVVGCGALARSQHLPNVARNPRMRLVVACDISAEAAESARRDFGAERCASDWREVVAADDVDMIVLATHTELRADLIVPALEAGKPVYVEKPLAHSMEEMLRVLYAEKRAGVPVCVGHNRRASPAFREMLRLLRLAREKGCDRPPTLDRSPGREWSLLEERQTQAVIRVSDDCRSWKPWAMRPGETALINEMTHFVDMGLLIMEGKVPVRVFCDGSPRGNFVVVVTFEDGSMFVIHESLGGNFDYPKEDVEVTHGFVAIAMHHHVEVIQRGLDRERFRAVFPLTPGSPPVRETGIAGFHASIDRARKLHGQGRIESPWCVGVEKGWYDLLDAFARFAVRGQGANPSDTMSAIRATMICLKAGESCASGRPVRVTPEDYDLNVHVA